MLSNTEKARFKDYDALDKKQKANLNYRVAAKIKKTLSEIDEVNEALDMIPEKTAMHTLNDDMVASVFTLAEKMLKILRYSSVKIDYMGAAYVAKTENFRNSRDGKSRTIEVKMKLANRQDMARQLLVDDHLAVLNHIMKEPPLGLPISEVPDCILDRVSCNDPEDVVGAMQMLTKWGRPGMRTFEKFGDRLKGDH